MQARIRIGQGRVAVPAMLGAVAILHLAAIGRVLELLENVLRVIDRMVQVIGVREPSPRSIRGSAVLPFAMIGVMWPSTGTALIFRGNEIANDMAAACAALVVRAKASAARSQVFTMVSSLCG